MSTRPAETGTPRTEVAPNGLDERAMVGFSVRTVGADKGYPIREFVQRSRDRRIAQHVLWDHGRKMPGLEGQATL